MSAAEWAQIGAAVFAAGAAGASWLSVLQSRKVISATESPELHCQALAVGQLTQPGPSNMAFAIHNAGGGLAKGVGFIFATDAEFVVQYAGEGFVQSDETVYVHTQMAPGEEWQSASRGVVFCRDRRERGQAWTLDGEHKGIGGRGRDWEMSATDIWLTFYPDSPLKRCVRYRRACSASHSSAD